MFDIEKSTFKRLNPGKKGPQATSAGWIWWTLRPYLWTSLSGLKIVKEDSIIPR